MVRSEFSRLPRALIVATALLCAATARAGGPVRDASAQQDLFARAEYDKTTNYSEFLHILNNLNQEEGRLSSPQKWHLRFLDAWQEVIAGKYAKAIPVLGDIISHSNDPVLEVRASGLKINILSRQKNYVKAYELANRLISDLPAITNSQARVEALNQIIQMLSFAGQFDQAREYINLLKSESRTGIARCKTQSYALNALFMGNRLSPTDPQLKTAIGLCLANREMIYAHTLQLDKAYLLITTDHTKQAINYLHRLTPSILKVKYQSHIVSLHTTMAQAYLSQDDYSDAKREALAAIALNSNSDSALELETPYYVLYETEKRTGNSQAALAYYEKYVKLDKASINDAKARALAYQMVKQEVTAKKLKLDALTKQNQILKLRQALEHKAAETSRLYIALLLVLVVFIGFWLYRIKHSQLRFRRMARHDALTGTFNRQHFFDEAERILRRLSKAGADVCLVLLDLDHFKRINDTYGHAAGDEVLRRAVIISRGELRTSDLLGRLGGEEFGILMPSCKREQGAEIGDRIRHALATASMKLDTGDIVTVSASFGLACSDTSGHSMTQLFTDADAALYSAKRGGRNQLIVGNGEDTEHAEQDFHTAPHPSR